MTTYNEINCVRTLSQNVRIQFAGMCEKCRWVTRWEWKIALKIANANCRASSNCTSHGTKCCINPHLTDLIINANYVRAERSAEFRGIYRCRLRDIYLYTYKFAVLSMVIIWQARWTFNGHRKYLFKLIVIRRYGKINSSPGHISWINVVFCTWNREKC